jgi:hypothetical protein
VNGLGLGCAGDCCAVVCTYMSADCMYASVCLSICYLLRVLFLHLSFVLAITKLSAGTAQVLHRLPAQVQGAEYLWYLHPAEQPSGHQRHHRHTYDIRSAVVSLRLHRGTGEPARFTSQNHITNCSVERCRTPQAHGAFISAVLALTYIGRLVTKPLTKCGYKASKRGIGYQARPMSNRRLYMNRKDREETNRNRRRARSQTSLERRAEPCPTDGMRLTE